MGFLDIFKKKPRKQNVNVSAGFILRDSDGNEMDLDSEKAKIDYEKLQREAREREEAYKKEQSENVTFLRNSGVDVDLFTCDKAISDALAVINAVCPPMRRFDVGLTKAEPNIVFSAPTKTGKVPKNVVEAYVSHIRGERGDNLGVQLHYLSDGTINMVNIYGWYKHYGQGVKIRRFGDEYRIVEVKRMDPDGSGEWSIQYKNQKPETNNEAIEELAKSVKYVFSM